MVGRIVLGLGKYLRIQIQGLVDQLTKLWKGLAQDQPLVVLDMDLPQGLRYQHVTLSASRRSAEENLVFKAAHEFGLLGLGYPRSHLSVVYLPGLVAVVDGLLTQ